MIDSMRLTPDRSSRLTILFTGVLMAIAALSFAVAPAAQAATLTSVTFTGISSSAKPLFDSKLDTVTTGSTSSVVVPTGNVLYLPSSHSNILNYTLNFSGVTLKSAAATPTETATPTASTSSLEAEPSVASAAPAAAADSPITGTIDLSTYTPVSDGNGGSYRLLIFRYEGASVYVYAYESASISSFYVNTSKGIAWLYESKENRDTASSGAMVAADGSVAYSAPLAEIKTRGNATSTYDKRPYQIKLSKKTELVSGAGSAKTWILLANVVDESLIRNRLIYDTGGEVGLAFTSKGTPVDLYIDGVYQGSYYMCEKVQIGGNRVEINDLESANDDVNPDLDVTAIAPTILTKTAKTPFSAAREVKYRDFTSPADVTGGYLLELELKSRYTAEASYFVTQRGTHFVIGSPEFANAEEVGYISGFMQDLEDALYSETGYNGKGRHYSEYIDITSFAKYYAMQELAANYDAFISSTYFYKDADHNGVPGKLYAGPLWDFDHCLGASTYELPYASAGKIYLGDPKVRTAAKSGWVGKLISHPDFRRTLSRIYKEYVMPAVSAQLTTGINAASDAVASSCILDNLRWSTYKTAKIHPYDNVLNLGDHTAAVTATKNYLSKRSAALSSSASFGAYSLSTTYHRVSVDPALAGSVEVTTRYVPSAKRAVVRDSSGSDAKLMATYTLSGVTHNVPLAKTDEKGLYTFIMPAADAVVTNNTDVTLGSIAEIPDQRYTRSKLTPPVVVYAADNSTVLVKGTDYSVSYSDNTDIGVAIVRVSGIGTYRGSLATTFHITADKGTYILSTALSSSKVLNIAKGSTANRANLQLWSKSGSTAQKFVLKLDDNGYYVITCSRSKLALDVAGGGTAPRTNVRQYTPNASTAQEWLLIPAGGGYYYLNSRCNGLNLDVADGKKTNGTNIHVYTVNHTKAQKFALIKM